MIEVSPKCPDYEEEANKAHTLLVIKKFVVIPPTILLIALGIVLFVIYDNAWLFIISLIGLMYAPCITMFFKERFDEYIKKIRQKYINYYSIKEKDLEITAVIEKDNKGYANIVGKYNILFCKCENGCLSYISASFLTKELGLATSAYDFKCFLRYDFGKLVIPIDDIDHYRESEIVCTYGEQVFRIKFTDDKAMDTYIPKKEFYYQSSKKD